MDTGQLEAFDRIVRDGSFSRAALALDLAQPTISARIRSLEEEVGGPLLVRGGRGVSLTERGVSFLPYARRALSILAEGKEAARLAETGQRGRVTLAVIESLTGGFFAEAVARFHRTHPQVELFVHAQHSEQILQLLDDGVVKLGLLTWPVFGVDLVPLVRFREPLVLTVPASHPLARRDEVTLEDAVRHGDPLLMVRWGPLARPLLARLAEFSVVPVEVPIDTARQMVQRGIGAAFLTRTLVTGALEAGRLVEVPLADLPPLFRESALVHLRRQALSTAATQFAEVLREEAGARGIARDP